MKFKLNQNAPFSPLPLRLAASHKGKSKVKIFLLLKHKTFKLSSKKMLVFFGSLAAQRHGNLFFFKLFAANL